jgi:hypothetical protein
VIFLSKQEFQMNNGQYTWYPDTNPNNPPGMPYYFGTTPLGTFTLSQDALTSFQTSGAFYNDPRVPLPQSLPQSCAGVQYSFYDPILVGWKDPNAYRRQPDTREYIAENVAAWVENNPYYGYFSPRGTNGALIRYCASLILIL